MLLLLSLFAAAYGAAAGLLVPRPAYRLAVGTEETWRTACPAGHPLAGPAHGWLGPARCSACAAGRPGTARTTAEPADEPAPAAGPAGEPDATAGSDGLPPPRCADAATTTAEPAEQRRLTRPDGGYGLPPARPGGWYGPRTVPVSAVTGAACAVIAAATGPRPELAVWLLLAPLAVTLALVDRAVHRLPDVLTLPLAVSAAVLLGLAELLPGNTGSWPGALVGGAALGAVYFLLFVINPSGMGFGDVKLALALGLALGWYGPTVLIAGSFAGFLAGALYGMGLMLLRRAGRKTAMPFGPFMIFGAFLGVLLGAPGPL